MHTYKVKLTDEAVSIAYEVWFNLDSGSRLIREFPTEEEAAAYVSYLNGGTDPRLVQRQLATLAPRRT